MTTAAASPFPGVVLRCCTNGWPLCPLCGYDELYSVLAVTMWPARPTLEQCIAAIEGCYRCGTVECIMGKLRAGAFALHAGGMS